jgi:large subunit ribosomal protein L22
VAATDTQTPISSRAEAKYVRLSARKARVVLDHIRGRTVPEARTILAFTPRAAAVDIEKVLRSAVANAESAKGLDGDDLVILAAYADEGPTLKRWRARARGRVNRIRKRTCHITLIVGETVTPGAPPKRRTAKPASEAAPKPEPATEQVSADEAAAEEKPKTSSRRRTPAKKKEVSA